LRESTSDRKAYATFFPIVTASPTIPLPSKIAAAHQCCPVAATARPATVSTNEITCQRIECGMKANG
jgi:hypothetical protein